MQPPPNLKAGRRRVASRGPLARAPFARHSPMAKRTTRGQRARGRRGTRSTGNRWTGTRSTSTGRRVSDGQRAPAERTAQRAGRGREAQLPCHDALPGLTNASTVPSPARRPRTGSRDRGSRVADQSDAGPGGAGTTMANEKKNHTREQHIKQAGKTGRQNRQTHCP